MEVSPQKKSGGSAPFLCFKRLVQSEILFINHEALMTYGIYCPHCHRRGRPKMALFVEHSRTMLVRVGK